jgi:predicted enzyme related to lactoylglutathione lyase
MDGVTHFDIPVDDVKRASGFYEKAFGWMIKKVPGMDYHMVSTTEADEKGMPKKPGAINGGMFMKESHVDCTVIVVNVPSIKDSLKLVRKAGGTVIMKKHAVGKFGFYAKVEDTEGNVVGVWEDRK